ncbi:MAG TPA: nucleoside transporter C-terminal domain-containing protein [Hyphomonas sp.]|nr:nucleoside:proton symporter [Hyphomonas sp.]HRI99189.1 nucleoside transporter C-terminal domain-containing protein [Hyphomonas sp.]HRK65930.1 nucleoside transporter C-terminal domain-containing protein [Hyphomonas sp.]
MLQNFQGIVGLGFILGLCWILSEDRSTRPHGLWIAGAIAVQIAIALIVTRSELAQQLIGFANDAVSSIERATLVGSSYMFGYTGGAPIPFMLKPGADEPVIIAFQILPLIIVFSALSALLWHWGVLRVIVRALSWALRRGLGVSGFVGLGGASTLFLGVVESPLILKAWLSRVSRSDLFAVMVLIMSTISGAIMILYASTLSGVVPDAIGHLISASIVSLPAAILIARIMVPGDGKPDTAPIEPDLKYESSMDAALRGTMEGVQLVLAVIGVIIVAFAFVNLVDQLLGVLPAVEGEPLTLRRLFGWLFAPLMWAIGIPADQAESAGALMGTKVILNEYVAYLDLAALPAGTLDPRSLLIMTYALSGVANLASVGLIVSTISTLAPDRKSDVASLGMKSWLAGNLASAMTGAVIGLVTISSG